MHQSRWHKYAKKHKCPEGQQMAHILTLNMYTGGHKDKRSSNLSNLNSAYHDIWLFYIIVKPFNHF